MERGTGGERGKENRVGGYKGKVEERRRTGRCGGEEGERRGVLGYREGGRRI